MHTRKRIDRTADSPKILPITIQTSAGAQQLPTYYAAPSDTEVMVCLVRELGIIKAREYAQRIAAVNGPLAAQYGRVARFLEHPESGL